MTVAGDTDMGPHRYKDGWCGRCGREWPCPAVTLAPPHMIHVVTGHVLNDKKRKAK